MTNNLELKDQFLELCKDENDFRQDLTRMFFNDFKSWMAEQASK